jgi:putative ABC transport system permease protein
MVSTSLKIAWRQIRKNRLYSFVNITGLTVGISSCLLIGIYILHEWSYDRFHKNAHRIVRVTMDYVSGDAPTKVAVTGTKVGPQFKRTFPEVEAFVRTLKYTRVIKYENQAYEEKQFLYADSAFFETFSFPLKQGDPRTALDAPNKIVLTEPAARKYFGKETALGKLIKVGTTDFIVTGVAEKTPLNSQIQFDFVASFNSLGASREEKWWEANYVTYLLLQPNANLQRLDKNISDYMAKVGRDELKLPANNYLTYHLEPLTSVHLHSALDGFEPNNSLTYIYILAIVGLMILLIASVNYTNLATAQSASRTGEIGIRKVMGALRMQVFRQFMVESFITTGIAILFAIGIAYLMLPFFNQLSGKEINADALVQGNTLLLLLLIGILVSVSSGIYPALMLSNLKIINILKAGFSFTSRGNQLRKSLIIIQFVISVFLIISTIVVLQQLSYIRHKDLGYDKEQVLVLPLDFTMQAGYESLKQEMLNQPGILNVTAAYESPVDIGWGDGISKSADDHQGITVNAIPVDKDFVKTMGIHILAGTDYTEADRKAMDTSDNNAHLRYTYMLNEAAVKSLGWAPEQAIGKTIYKGQEGIVKAVVKDFHFKSFHNPITPLVIFLDERMAQEMFVKVDGKNIPGTLQRLGKIWRDRVAHRPFEYHFLDEDYSRLYKSEERTAGIFTTFSSLAIFLACLGLFALTAYSIVQRTKEIGIRKILGANISSIITLLSKDFLFLVLIGFIIASPIAWYATHRWLQDFSYRINIQWWVFAVAGIAAILISIITISFQALKAAVGNPVKSLRSE